MRGFWFVLFGWEGDLWRGFDDSFDDRCEGRVGEVQSIYSVVYLAEMSFHWRYDIEIN